VIAEATAWDLAQYYLQVKNARKTPNMWLAVRDGFDQSHRTLCALIPSMDFVDGATSPSQGFRP
jgi:hypothetical protein